MDNMSDRALPGENREEESRMMGWGELQEGEADRLRIAEEKLRDYETQIQELKTSLQEADLRLAAANADRAFADQRLQAMLRSLPVAVWITDASGRILNKNEMADRIWGGDAPLSKAIEEYRDYQGRWTEGGEPLRAEDWALARAIQLGETIIGDKVDIERFDGKKATILNSAAPIIDVNGQLLGAVAVAQDITLERQAKAILERDRTNLALREQERMKELELANLRLQESEARYRQIVETANEGIWIIGPGGEISFANSKMAELLGSSVEALEQSTIWEFMDAENRLLVQTDLDQGRDGTRVERDVKFLRTDGQPLWTILSTTPVFDEQGAFLGALGMVTDINERKQAEDALRTSEERFRLVVDSVKDYAIFALDPRGTVVSWNSGAQAIKGYRAEEIIGQNYSRFYLPDQVQAGLPQFALKQASTYGRFEMENWRVRKDGTRFWANVVITALYNADRELVGYAKISRDMTDRKEAEAALRRQAVIARLQQKIAAAANQATSPEAVLGFALDQICELGGWDVGHAFGLYPHNPDYLASLNLWRLDDAEGLEEFRKATQDLEFRKGEGLVGSVFSTGEAVWVEDLPEAENYHRRVEASRAGLHAGVAFPIKVGSQVVGIMEFFARRSAPRDEEMLEALVSIGTQLGRVVEREQSERALRESETRFRTIFDNAPVGIETVDLQGGLQEVNPAALDIFGVEQDAMNGQPEVSNQVNVITSPMPSEQMPANPALVTPLSPDLDPASLLFERLRSGEINSYRISRPYRRRDGKLLWGRLSVSLVRDEEGNPQYVIGMLEDETESRQLEGVLADLKRQQIEDREEERTRLSQELHDGPLQDLVGVVFHLKAFSDDLPESVDKAQVREMQGKMQHIVSTLRVICSDLRPPTLAPFGLEKAIRSHAEDIQEAHPELLIGLDLEPDGQSLPGKTRLAMYRIYQQAISNVIQHAQARNVLVRLRLNDRVILEVIDDGQGFQIPERWIDLARDGHLGLVGAFEQASAIGARLEVESEIGLGTTLRLTAQFHPYPTGFTSRPAEENP